MLEMDDGLSKPTRKGNILMNFYPIASGPDFPVTPLPNPGEGGPVDPNPGANVPVVPLPNPGEGGPVDPNPGQTIPSRPQPYPPCYYCDSRRTGKVRFLNAVLGYHPFRIYLGSRPVVRALNYASLTGYGRVSDGFQTVTVMGQNGYIYLQKSLPFRADEASTVAIIQTAGGMDLLQIPDTPCQHPRSMSCLRACNLAYYSPPLDIVLADGRVVYSDVRFKESTPFKRVRPGNYQFYLAQTDLRPMPRDIDIETLDLASDFTLPEALVSFSVDIRQNRLYTAFILNWSQSPDALQVLTVEDPSF